MKVRATRRGYAGNVLYEPGQEFQLGENEAFSAKWMTAAEPDPPKDPAPKPKPKPAK